MVYTRQLPPLDRDRKLVGESSAEKQSQQVLAKLDAVLKAAGSVPYYRFPGPFAPSIEDRLIGKVKEMARAPDGK